MEAWREDPNKVFIGSLHPQINKPQVMALLSEVGMTPFDVIVPQGHAGKLAVAFIIFEDPSECAVCIGKLQGLVFCNYAPGTIKAHRGDPSQGGL
jgi:hypothetical protein